MRTKSLKNKSQVNLGASNCGSVRKGHGRGRTRRKCKKKLRQPIVETVSLLDDTDEENEADNYPIPLAQLESTKFMPANEKKIWNFFCKANQTSNISSDNCSDDSSSRKTATKLPRKFGCVMTENGINENNDVPLEANPRVVFDQSCIVVSENSFCENNSSPNGSNQPHYYKPAVDGRTIECEQHCFNQDDYSKADNPFKFDVPCQQMKSSKTSIDGTYIFKNKTQEKNSIDSEPTHCLTEETTHNEEASTDPRLCLDSVAKNAVDLEKSGNNDSDIIFVDEIDAQDDSVIIIEDDPIIPPKKLSKKAKKKKCQLLKEIALRQRNFQIAPNTYKTNTFGNAPLRKIPNFRNISANNVEPLRSGLREIVIDGSNVAFGHSNGEYFSVRGLYIAIQYFLERGHKVTAFVPQFRLKAGQCSCPPFLKELGEKRYVIFTPSREVFDRRITPYDDRYIIQYADLKEAVVMSNDNYRDLLIEKSEWRSVIENRLLMYTWVEDLLMFPEDPLGRHGPSLSEFLRFS